jgi:hypothetical protein
MGKLLQLTFDLAAGGLEFNEQNGPISDCQNVSVRRSLNRVRDLSPRPDRQEPQTLHFELQVDQLFLCEKASNRPARTRGPRPY